MAFHVWIILNHLGMALPHENNFSRVKDSYVKSVYYRTFDDSKVNANETWLNVDWFYTAEHGVFDDGGKATQSSLPSKLIQSIILQSKDFKRKDTGKVSTSVRTYVYLVLTSEVQAR